MRLSHVEVVSRPSAPNGGKSADADNPSRPSAPALVAADESIPLSPEDTPSAVDTADAASHFERVRPRLFGIAYRMLGGTADAEDVVQDVWVRWQGADRAQVRDRVAFLVTVTTRLALNAATSARARREVPVGPWLPERVLATDDPAQEAVRTGELAVAVHLLLRRLTAVERAVFVLREAFDYPFREIAGLLRISEPNARQLARRARMRLAERRPAGFDPSESGRLLQAFLHAAQAGDMAPLLHLLADDVVSRPDGRRGAPEVSPFDRRTRTAS